LKAVIWTKYGPPEVLELREVPKPTPKDNDVLVEVYATTVTAGETEMRRFQLPLWTRIPLRLWLGIWKPRKILGQEVAGVVEAVGRNVTAFKAGDQVFGTTGLSFGAYAEYVCLPEKPEEGRLTLKPSKVSFEESAALPVAGLEALHILRKTGVGEGTKVLVNGSGGSIGTFAVQLAKYFGAEVTAVDSTEKLEMLRSIGADQAIDYTLQDFTKNSQAYDVILDVAGKSSFSKSSKALKENGRYASANPKLSDMLRARWASQGGKKVVFWATQQKLEDLRFLGELMEAEKIKSIIDRCFALEEIVEAHRYAESGHKKGNIVVTVKRDKRDTA
jgi:NADPH:quinone reductase-like Zn-dependent oxidoreductase